MPSFTITLLGFLISTWPIASTTYQSDNIINIDDVSHGFDLAIEDKDIDYDLLSEDYLDYDNFSNETERETRELRFKKAYKTVTKSSTGNYWVKSCIIISYPCRQASLCREPDDVCVKDLGQIICPLARP